MIVGTTIAGEGVLCPRDCASPAPLLPFPESNQRQNAYPCFAERPTSSAAVAGPGRPAFVGFSEPGLMTRDGDCLPLPQVLAPRYFFLDQRHHGNVGSRGNGGVNCRDVRRMLRYGVEKRLPAGEHARMRSL